MAEYTGYGMPRLDLSVLGDLGTHYNEGQRTALKERTLAELGKLLQTGQPIDYKQVGGLLARIGDVGGAMSALQMGQLAENDEQVISRLRGGGPAPARPPIQAPRGPVPAGAPVQSTPRVMGDDEGVRSGLYDPPTTPGARPPIQGDAAPVMAPSPNGPGRMAPIFGAASPVVAPPPATPAETVGQRFPQQAGQPVRAPAPGLQGGRGIDPMSAELVMMMRRTSPGLQAALGKVLEHTLKANDPHEAMKLVRDLVKTSHENPRSIGLTGPNDPRIMRVIEHRLGGITTAGGESEYDKGMAKVFVDYNKDSIQGAASARSQVAAVTRLQHLLSNPNVYTGTGGNFVTDVKRMATSLGIDTAGLSEGVGAAEAARSIGNQLTLQLRNPAGGAGMPGALSDNDLKFLTAIPPNLGQTPEGIKLVADYMKRVSQRSIDVERRRQAYVKEHGRLNEGFLRELDEWSHANPLFPEAERPAPAPSPAGGVATGQGAAAPVTSGNAAGGWRRVPQ